MIVMACDSSGAIGMKEHDNLRVKPEIVAQYCLKVCLNEVFSVAATPNIIISTVSNEFEPTGKKILAEIKRQCELFDIVDYTINGSSEENFVTTMTALGISVMASADQLHWKKTESDDYCYLYGLPYVGEEVIAHSDTVLNPHFIQTILARYDVHDFLPCGSSGIKKEIDVLCEESNLAFDQTTKTAQALLTKSAGPATCGIFSTKERLRAENITLLGQFKDKDVM